MLIIFYFVIMIIKRELWYGNFFIISLVFLLWNKFFIYNKLYVVLLILCDICIVIYGFKDVIMMKIL